MEMYRDMWRYVEVNGSVWGALDAEAGADVAAGAAAEN